MRRLGINELKGTSRRRETSLRADPARRTTTASICTQASGCPPNDRAGLERLCRYLLQPPLAQDRRRLLAHLALPLGADPPGPGPPQFDETSATGQHR